MASAADTKLIRDVGVFRRIFEDWADYPDNIKPCTSEKLTGQFKRHFDLTQETVLLQVPGKSAARRKQVEKSTKVVFHDCGINDKIANNTQGPGSSSRDTRRLPALLQTSSTLESGATLVGQDNAPNEEIPGNVTREDSPDTETTNISGAKDVEAVFGLHLSPEQLKHKTDPVCRFILINTIAADSRKLGITEETLFKILTCHLVSPAFLNYISYFGNNSLTNNCDLLFGGFRSTRSFSCPNLTPKVLDRSGYHYQLDFELKTVFRPEYLNEDTDGGDLPNDGSSAHDSDAEHNGGWNFLPWWRRRDAGRLGTEIVNPRLEDLGAWRLDPTAIHHQFDVVTGRSQWIIAGFLPEEVASEDPRVDELFPPENVSSSSSIKERLEGTLMVLAWLAEWSLSEFALYINTIDKNIQTLTIGYVNDTEGAKVSQDEVQVFKMLNRQMEFLDGCVAVLEANLRTCKRALDFYKTQLLQDMGGKLKKLELEWTKGGSRRDIEEHIETFAINMQNTCDAINETLLRAGELKQQGTRRDSIVQRILQHRNEGIMRDLAKVTHKDSTTIIIFSTITLILLPVSVVSTIFSAGIVRFDSDTGGFAGNWSGPAAIWWAAATVLVTTAVFIAEWTWREKAKEKMRVKEALRQGHFAPGRPPSYIRIEMHRAYYHIKDRARTLFRWGRTGHGRDDGDDDGRMREENNSVASAAPPWTEWFKVAVYDRVKELVWKPASTSRSGSDGEMEIHCPESGQSPRRSPTQAGGRWQDDFLGDEGGNQQPTHVEDYGTRQQRNFDEVNNMERGQPRGEE